MSCLKYITLGRTKLIDQHDGLAAWREEASVSEKRGLYVSFLHVLKVGEASTFQMLRHFQDCRRQFLREWWSAETLARRLTFLDLLRECAEVFQVLPPIPFAIVSTAALSSHSTIETTRLVSFRLRTLLLVPLWVLITLSLNKPCICSKLRLTTRHTEKKKPELSPRGNESDEPSNVRKPL